MVLLFLTGAVALAIIVTAVALVVAQRVRTGKWAVPDRETFVWVKNRLMPGDRVPRVIYLNRDKTTITAGQRDDSHTNKSGLIGRHGLDKATLPGWRGSKRGWKSVVKCVEKQFAPFDVQIVTKRPEHPGYVMVLVGGRARDIGITKGHHFSGLAPYNADVVPDPIVFAFARQVRHKARTVCETIAMEVGHAYGLDHGYLCKDAMTYLQGCGKKSFVDKTVPCGEHKQRACNDGKPTQNSYRRLLDVLGEHIEVDAISGGA